jgi:3-hydroxyacyl-CoA dehydrogenase
MSKHDEDLLVVRNQQLVRALSDVLAIIEAVPEDLRVQAGLYSMPAFNIAYALIEKEKRRAKV